MSRKNLSYNSILANDDWMKLRCVDTQYPDIKRIVDMRHRLVMADVRVSKKADLELTQQLCEKISRLIKEYYANCALNL